jgi:hypothetical protein
MRHVGSCVTYPGEGGQGQQPHKLGKASRQCRVRLATLQPTRSEQEASQSKTSGRPTPTSRVGRMREPRLRSKKPPAMLLVLHHHHYLSINSPSYHSASASRLPNPSPLVRLASYGNAIRNHPTSWTKKNMKRTCLARDDTLEPQKRKRRKKQILSLPRNGMT